VYYYDHSVWYGWGKVKSHHLYRKDNGEYKQYNGNSIVLKNDKVEIDTNSAFQIEIYLMLQVLNTDKIYPMLMKLTSCAFEDHLSAIPLNIELTVAKFYGKGLYEDIKISNLFPTKVDNCEIQEISLVKNTNGS
jgi:hypothetical protein